MKWSYRLGRIRGIDIKVHLTFLLIPIFLLMIGGAQSFGAFLFLLICILLLFGCVILHELGHSVVAQAHGIRVRDITLLPIGGVARLEDVPEEPWTELKIAIAGPAVNLAIFMMLTPVLIAVGLAPSVGLSILGGDAAGLLGRCLQFLWISNFMLMAFNLIPAFPLDGGRVFRAILALRIDYVKATEIATKVGKVIALGLVILGFFGFGGWLWMIVIAAFIYLAGTNELRLVRLRRLRRTILLPGGAELIPPGVPDQAVPQLSRGLLFDFGVYNHPEVRKDFERILRHLQDAGYPKSP